MLNRLSYELNKALNEAEEIEVCKKVFTENTYLNENCKEEKLEEEIETEEQKTELEERLASLKTQLEVDGDQLADDEKEAIQQEIAEIENELNGAEADDKIMTEDASGTDAYDQLVAGDDIFFRDEEGQALLGHYADHYPEPEEYDEGYVTGWNKGEDPEYDKKQEEKFQKAKQAAANKDVWEFRIVDENTLQPTGEIYGYAYGQDELMDLLGAFRRVNKISKLEETSEKEIQAAREDSIEKGLLTESEFKVGDVVKVPYRYGAYTPGEFTEAPIISISDDGKFITVEIPSKLELTAEQLGKFQKEALGECDMSLQEAYSDKLGGDPEDFVKDVEVIKQALHDIDTSKFGSFLAEQMVEDWIETCNYQIEKGKRLASGDEFYSEADEKVYKDEDEAAYYRNKELYANSNLARHREAMEKAKKACEEKGIKLDESEETKETPIAEAEVTGLKEVKNQGNVYMLEDENNKFIVGENYNKEEGLIENAEIYDNKEAADKDYLDRCEITGGSEETEVVEEA